MGGFMLYLYRASLLLLAITFALGLEKAPMAWAVLLLIPGTVSGFYVGVALHKEALDEMQAEEEEEFEYSALVGPYFSRMVKEMFLVFLVGGLLAGAYGLVRLAFVEGGKRKRFRGRFRLLKSTQGWRIDRAELSPDRA